MVRPGLNRATVAEPVFNKIYLKRGIFSLAGVTRHGPRRNRARYIHVPKNQKARADHLLSGYPGFLPIVSACRAGFDGLWLQRQKGVRCLDWGRPSGFP